MTSTTFYIFELGRLYLFVLIISALIGKMVSLATFGETVKTLTGLPVGMAQTVAAIIIGAEAVTALLLAAGGIWSRVGVAVALILFVAFSVVLSTVLIQRRSISCNCFGKSEHIISTSDLVRNTALIALCILYLLFAPLGHGSATTVHALLGGAAIILFLVTTNVDTIVRWVR